MSAHLPQLGPSGSFVAATTYVYGTLMAPRKTALQDIMSQGTIIRDVVDQRDKLI
jgi:hypothetical protein